MANPGASSNTDGMTPKGGCSTKPVVATAYKKAAGYTVTGDTANPALTLEVSPDAHFAVGGF